MLDEGYLYSVKYNMSFSCNVVNMVDSKWTWNRIFEILHQKQVVKTHKVGVIVGFIKVYKY